VAILDGQDILYLARVRSYQAGQHEIDMGLRVGARLPAHYTAKGKLLLAHLPEEEQREAMKGKLSRRTWPAFQRVGEQLWHEDGRGS
jgi:DNA-binding IclR family transcriptional regulator